MFKKYIWHKQTIKELSITYKKSKRWIKYTLEKYEVVIKQKQPRKMVAIVDSTFFGKRIDQFGVSVIIDAHKKESVLWKYINTEKGCYYVFMRRELEQQDFEFLAVVVDGSRPLLKAFPDIPVQLCHFHQKAIIRRYLTKNPKLPASIHLKQLTDTLGSIDKKEFEYLFKRYLIYWEYFLKEKTFNPETKRWFYTHKQLRSAVRSIKTNLPYLFTYQDYPELNIPNTTNLLDGGVFSFLKRLLKNHNGLSRNFKKKLIDEILENQFSEKR